MNVGPRFPKPELRAEGLLLVSQNALLAPNLKNCEQARWLPLVSQNALHALPANDWIKKRRANVRLQRIEGRMVAFGEPKCAPSVTCRKDHKLRYASF
jgi:hypothetical protein